jgi:uncharacterized protein
MTSKNARMLFINLPVKDLKRSVDFFTKLGFEFNPQAADEASSYMVISDQAFVMLMVESRYRQMVEGAGSAPSHVGLVTKSRAEVDHLVNAAVASGGSHAQPAQDHGFMYSWSFKDPDGYHWELVSMEPAAA